MQSLTPSNAVLRTPRRPAVVVGLTINASIILLLLLCPFVIHGQGNPNAAWRFWMYLYMWIFPILIPAIISLLYIDFVQINWHNNRFHCLRTISRLRQLMSKSSRHRNAGSLHYAPTQVSLVWEGTRLLLYCDGLPSGIYLGRGTPAKTRLQWFLDKGVPSPFQV